jgi:hypothetical protein
LVRMMGATNLCSFTGRRALELQIGRHICNLSLAALASAAGSPNWLEVTAGIAFFALIGAIAQLLLARRSTHRRNAFGYFERYNSPSALPYIAEMIRLLSKSAPSENDDTRWDTWKAKKLPKRLNSVVFVNFWEELGGLYNRRLVDRKVIRMYFGAALVELWEEGAWFIKRAQKEDPRAFEEWGKMVKNTKKWLDRRDHPKRQWLRRGAALFLIVLLGATGFLIERGSKQSGQTIEVRRTGELLKLAEEIEGGSAHGVLYGIAEVAEGQQ